MKKLSDVRLQNNKTQEQMAKILGVAVSTYNQYEKAQRSIPNDIAEKIANILNVEISDIFLPTKFTVREI